VYELVFLNMNVVNVHGEKVKIIYLIVASNWCSHLSLYDAR